MHRLTALALVTTLLGLAALGCASADRPRLILLIVVDTLRADRLGCYGYEQIETPNLDRLAERGTLYHNAVTAVPVTLPSVATLLTGAYPLQHGVRDNSLFTLGESWETLPERLQTAGYRTGAFVPRPCSLAARGSNRDSKSTTTTCPPTTRRTIPRWRRCRRASEASNGGLLSRSTGPSNGRSSTRNEQVLLMVHLFDPHLPRDPPPSSGTDTPAASTTVRSRMSIAKSADS